MSSQRFCLRWNNHQSNLLSVFDQLLHAETFTDVTLAVEGQYLKAHKMILSACSPYFQQIFVNHAEKHPIVILKDVPFGDMKSLLDFMYRGEVSVDQERLTAFLKVAESLRIKGLTEVNDDKQHHPQPFSGNTSGNSGNSITGATSNTTSTSSPPQLHRIQPYLVQQRAKGMMQNNPLLGSALTQPKRKRGRPRKLSGSSNGTGNDFDDYESRDNLVQGSPEMLEVKMGTEGYSGNEGSDENLPNSGDNDNDQDSPNEHMDTTDLTKSAPGTNANTTPRNNQDCNSVSDHHSEYIQQQQQQHLNRHQHHHRTFHHQLHPQLQQQMHHKSKLYSPKLQSDENQVKRRKIDLHKVRMQMQLPPITPTMAQIGSALQQFQHDSLNNNSTSNNNNASNNNPINAANLNSGRDDAATILPILDQSSTTSSSPTSNAAVAAVLKQRRSSSLDDIIIDGGDNKTTPNTIQPTTTPSTDADAAATTTTTTTTTTPIATTATTNTTTAVNTTITTTPNNNSFTNNHNHLRNSTPSPFTTTTSQIGTASPCAHSTPVPTSRSTAATPSTPTPVVVTATSTLKTETASDVHTASVTMTPTKLPQRRRIRRKANLGYDEKAEHLTEMSVRGLDLFRYASISEGIYQCTECAKENVQKTFKNKYSFQRHAFLYHEGTQRKVFPCPVCSKEFSRPDKMKNHLKMTHECFMPNATYPVSYLLPKSEISIPKVEPTTTP